MSQTPGSVTDAVWEYARRHFLDKQLVKLAATVAIENYQARFNRAFLVEPQHYYRPA